MVFLGFSKLLSVLFTGVFTTAIDSQQYKMNPKSSEHTESQKQEHHNWWSSSSFILTDLEERSLPSLQIIFSSIEIYNSILS